MLTVTRTGNALALAADMRAIPAQKVPLITAKALTFTVQKAQADILRALPGAFAGGATRYTLGATRIETATPEKLEARVAVKDQAATGNLPENYLLPGVFGGARKEKRFERALRYAGLLQAGESALPGDGATLDAFGNFPVGALRTLINSTAGLKRGRTTAAAGRVPGKRTRGDVFVGTPGKKGALPGIYKREGRKLSPLLVFVRKRPTYTSRFDFAGIAAATTQREFESTFARLLRAAL